MTTNGTAVQELVQKITQEALRQLEMQGSLNRGILAVIADPVFDASGIARYLRDRQSAVTVALLGPARFAAEGIPSLALTTPESQQALAGTLANYSEVVLLTPSLSLLRTLAQGDDREFAAALILRPLLWGKPVTLLLDFTPPRSRRSPFYEQLSSDLQALELMGVTLSSLQPAGAVSAESERRDLVTEQDVKAAHALEQRSIRIKPAAIVTQLARETAQALGVSIEV